VELIEMDFGRYTFGAPYFGWLCNGVIMTLVISVTSGFSAAVIGFIIFRLDISEYRWRRIVGVAFVTIFRNLPLLPLLLFLTFALPGVWRQLWGRPFPLGFELYVLLLGLSLNTAAYIAEIFWSGFTAVAPEQVFAARTLGLGRGAVRRRVIYPQALRIAAPALASRFIHNMKNSTLALVVPMPVEMMDVVGQAGRIAGQTFSWAEPLIFAACIYLVLALALSRALNRWATREQAKVWPIQNV
jgi:polar amino acid transport system permease protein